MARTRLSGRIGIRNLARVPGAFGLAPLVIRPAPNLTRFTTRNHSPNGIQVAGSFSETETAVAWISFTAIIVVN